MEIRTGGIFSREGDCAGFRVVAGKISDISTADFDGPKRRLALGLDDFYRIILRHRLRMVGWLLTIRTFEERIMLTVRHNLRTMSDMLGIRHIHLIALLVGIVMQQTAIGVFAGHIRPFVLPTIVSIVREPESIAVTDIAVPEKKCSALLDGHDLPWGNTASACPVYAYTPQG